MFTAIKNYAARNKGYVDYEDAFRDTCAQAGVEPNKAYRAIYATGFWGTLVTIVAAPVAVGYLIAKKIK